MMLFGDFHLGYRTQQEFDSWILRCPIRLHRELMAFVQLYVGVKADVHLRMEVSSRHVPPPAIGTTLAGPAPRLAWTTVLPADEARIVTIPLGVYEAFPAPGPNPLLTPRAA